MSTIRNKKRLLGLAALAASLGIALAGCSASGEAVGNTTQPSSSSAVNSGALEAAYAGVVGTVPTQPVAVPDGISAWVVSCGQSQTTCSTPAEGTSAAAKALGWESNICDGQLNPNGWANCIRQGVAASADVIFVIGQDCSSFQGPLGEAKAAGIMTIGVGANDCDVNGDEALYSGITKRMQGMDNEAWWNKLGELQAQWLIGQTEGDTKVLEVMFSDTLFGTWISAGLNAALEACDSCEVVGTLQLSNQDAASGAMAQKLSSALLQASDANAVAVPIDGWFMAGLSQAIESSQRSDELSVIGAFGQRSNIDLIEAGQGQDATVAFSMEWDGWSGVDTALRLMAEQEIQPSGIGFQVIDAKNNVPEAGMDFAYNPQIDFKAAYLAAWGKQ